MLRGIWTAAAFPVLALAAAGCGSGTAESSHGLTCGVGTHEQGTHCVANPLDGGSADAPTKATDAAEVVDSGDARPLDAGSPVKNGDPCPDGHDDACYQNHVYSCQLVANGDGHPVGTLWYDLADLDVSNCSLLAGKCTIAPVGGQGECTGGGYTACATMLTDAGNAIDQRRCYSSGVLEWCNGSGWIPADCTRQGLVCIDPGDGGVRCAPP